MKVETVAEQILFATLRIEATRPEGPNSVATGFIMYYKWADGKQGLFLITNKHVVENTVKGQLTFTLADQDSDQSVPLIGKSTSLSLVQDAWKWTGHPSGDIDIAALPLAIALNHLNEKEERIFFKSIQADIIPAQDALEDLDAVEDVLFVGYPSGLYDRTNNLPISRKGTTATHPSVDYEGKAVFLIDASVFPGSSGSPVFIYNNGPWSTRKGTIRGGVRVFFLGVLGSVYYREDDGSLKFEEIPTAVKPVIKTKEMIDLGIVYKSRTVVETIDHLLREYGEMPVESTIVEDVAP